MCDTMVVLGNASADGAVIFAKNSDREPNEAHELVQIPAADHAEGSSVSCTYVRIPQVPHTYAVLLAKPYWIWGAEMGANEHGVTIGNEAVFSKIAPGKEPGLIGMDFLRLGLERGKTAREALDVITELLEEHGQSGNCGHTHGLYYHNSFLIADPREAWVLETVDRMWVAEKVRGVRSISNGYTIGRTWDMASPNVVEYALEKGWCKTREDFDFARCYSDFIFTRFSDSARRQACSTSLLKGMEGRLTATDLMQVLRDHGPDSDDDWSPAPGLARVSICWHAGPGPIRNSQSVGSMVSQLSPERQTHWVTGTSAPCTGLFKPVWLDAGLPDQGERPGKTYTRGARWWQHETFHREVLRDFAPRLSLFRASRDALEAEFYQRAQAMLDAPPQARAALSQECLREADQFYQEWRPRVAAKPLSKRLPLLYAIAWQGFNRDAGLLNRDRVREEIQRQREKGAFSVFKERDEENVDQE